MQAVIKIGSSQFLVSPGMHILASRPQIDQTLYPTGAKVTFENLGSVKGQKIKVFKYKAKSRYRKTIGFRPKFHKLRIIDIREK